MQTHKQYEEGTTATLRFLKSEALHSTELQEIDSSNKSGGEYFEEVNVALQNGREKLSDLSLEKEGFVLCKHSSAVNDFFDDEQLEKIYTPEIKTLLKRLTHCDEVLVFNHTRRSSDPTNANLNKPALTVHNDFTKDSLRKKLVDFVSQNDLPFDIESFKRISIVIVWRSCKGEITSFPLALCDVTSITKNQIRSVFRNSALGKNEVQLATFHPGNTWYYFPNMQKDEAIAFRSADWGAEAQEIGVIHSAVNIEPNSRAVEARESIESRCFVLWK